MTLWSCKKTAWLYKKFTFKIYDVLTWKSNITLLPYIPRRKASEATKFGQLIGYKVEIYRNILKISCKPNTFSSSKAFSKNKNRSGTSLPVLFSAWILKEKIIWLYYINWPSFIVWLSLLREILGMCFVIVC